MSETKLTAAEQADAEAKAKAEAEAKAADQAEKPKAKKASAPYRVLLGTIVAGGKSVSAADEEPFVDVPADEARKLIAEGVIERA